MIRFTIRALSFLILLYVLGYALFVVALPQPEGDRRTDALVVLTGGAGRIERGIDLLRRRQAARMLISGVQRTVRPQELAAQHRVNQAIFDCCIDLGQEAIDTRSNGSESAAWVKKHRYRSVRLVTTDWHMRRARFELDQALPAGVTIIGDAVRSEPDLGILFREYHKYLLRRLAVVFGL